MGDQRTLQRKGNKGALLWLQHSVDVSSSGCGTKAVALKRDVFVRDALVGVVVGRHGDGGGG